MFEGHKKLKDLTELVLGALIWFLIGLCIPIGLCFILITSIWKCFVVIWIRLRWRKKKLEHVGYSDTMFSLQGCSHMIGYALLGQEGKKMRLEKLREHFHNTFIHGGKEEKVKDRTGFCVIMTRLK
jgi:hypothetical protein